MDDITEPERYPPQFGMILDIMVQNAERNPPKPPQWVSKPPSSFKRETLFSTAFEMQECIEKFGERFRAVGFRKF